jgi:hypothetical protein
VALAMSLIALLVLSTLIIAFSVLSSTEPTIASNHLRGVVAREVAEAGLERVIWALNNPDEAGGLPHVPPAAWRSPMPPPFDGSGAMSLTVSGTVVGVFRATVTPGGDPWRAEVRTDGWAPTDDPADRRPRAYRRITVTLMKMRNIAHDAPCALCVRGDLSVTGLSVVTARSDVSCGRKPGTYTSGRTTIGGEAARVYGANGTTELGNAIGSDVTGAHDVVQPDPASPSQLRQVEAAFEALGFKRHEVNALRAVARDRGTYHRGAVAFGAAQPMPDGLIFVDGPGAQVVIHGAAGGRDNVFNGWIVVDGAISIAGDIRINGLVYAMDTLRYTPAGRGRIEGQAISLNVSGGATEVDRATVGEAPAITLRCAHVENGGAGAGQLPRTWFVQPGSYRAREG